MMRTILYIYSLLLIFLLHVSCSKNEFPSVHIVETSHKIGWGTKTVCNISFWNEDTQTERHAKAKRRGGISSKYDKASFAIELDSALSFLGLPTDDDWILNANYIDKTFMRHKISYDLFRQMNPSNKAPQCAYVNLFFNSHYEGLYVLMERMDAKRLCIDKKDSLAMIFKDPPVFHENKFDSPEDSSSRYHQKFPNSSKKLKDYYLDAFYDFLTQSDDSLFSSAIGRWVDVNNIIDWHILLLFSNNSDGVLKNFYLYKEATNVPFKIALWDYDHSFGRDGDGELNMMKTTIDCSRSVLFKRLMTTAWYKPLLANRWQELRENKVLSTANFEKHIADNHQVIQKQLDNNFKRWPANAEHYFDDNDYQQELIIMKQFVALRLSQLDSYFVQP